MWHLFSKQRKICYSSDTDTVLQKNPQTHEQNCIWVMCNLMMYGVFLAELASLDYNLKNISHACGIFVGLYKFNA